jgi:hypothetical protein
MTAGQLSLIDPFRAVANGSFGARNLLVWLGILVQSAVTTLAPGGLRYGFWRKSPEKQFGATRTSEAIQPNADEEIQREPNRNSDKC